MSQTYRDLVDQMKETFTEEQWDSDVTVELTSNGEVFKGKLMICDTGHETLDENHPVILVQDT